MNEGGRKPAENGAAENDSDEPLELLRAKYLDYCSAQLADLLLYLSPDEIFVLSEKISSEDPDSAGAGYGRIVRVATEWLAERVALPPFDVWLRDYRANPERYDSYLMGLWETGVPSRPGDTPE